MSETGSPEVQMSAPASGHAAAHSADDATDAWRDVRDELRSRGLRWTPQRRLILEVLSSTEGHITGSEVVERCRERDPETTPSTVYRTLDVLEELGYVSHSHSAAGREEYHVLPGADHGHLQCRLCGTTWELEPELAAGIVEPIERRHGFVTDVGHLTISGLCAECAAARSGSR
jgi:Fur family ferric uptake transcriptional regulator